MGVHSPLRYPGAKGRQVPALSRLLLPLIDGDYCEPFVGGGAMALHVAQEIPTARLWLNDADPLVWAFWRCVSDKRKAALLVSHVRRTRPTVRLLDALRERPRGGLVEEAYKCLYYNRTCFSGILTAGPIGGRQQAGRYTVDCRWNSSRIATSIETVAALLSGRTHVSGIDGTLSADPHSTLYVDPPYYDKGDSLYAARMGQQDHESLALTLRSHSKWVLSYDNAPEIRKMYARWARVRGLDVRYSISGEGREAWNSARELVITPPTKRDTK